MPVLHRTVVAKPAIFGLDDHLQDVAFRTVARKVTEPPEAPTVFVDAPALAKVRPPRPRAMLTILTANRRFIKVTLVTPVFLISAR